MIAAPATTSTASRKADAGLFLPIPPFARSANHAQGWPNNLMRHALLADTLNRRGLTTVSGPGDGT
jgi:hypothetical protein